MQTTLRARASAPAVARRAASSRAVAAKAPVAAFASLKVSSASSAAPVVAKKAGLAAARRVAVASPVALPSFVAEAKKSVGEYRIRGCRMRERAGKESAWGGGVISRLAIFLLPLFSFLFSTKNFDTGI